MFRRYSMLVAIVGLVIGGLLQPAVSQDPQDSPAEVEPVPGAKDQTPNELTRGDKALVNDAEAADAGKAKTTFDEKFNEYKAAMRDVEKLNAQYQSADEATRKKLNEQLSGQIAHMQSLVNAMVDAAVAVYRAAPNADPKIAEYLIAVAKYYTVGRQTGPGESSPHNPDDVYYPIDGGDQYERARPIIKLLIDGGADNKQLYVWGFLAAYMTNDYDLAAKYLAKAEETGALTELAQAATKDPKSDPEAGMMYGVMMLVNASAENLDQYREYWAKESEIRAAEAKADDLPRVKLATTKGGITLELFENEAPQSVANFITLVRQGFYNGTPLHRVLPKFMAQGGDPTGEGTGGPGYSIRGEAAVPNYRKHFRGTLSMAHSGHPDSGGSQFFLTFVPTAHLNGRHTAFGRVIEGMEVLGDLQRRSGAHQANPPEPDKIIKAEVIRDRGHEYKFDKLPER
jgi:cyclophilin family peptidyl-prolyl cis-trans isomerase